MEEPDMDFKLKKKTISYLEDTKKVFQKMIPPLFEVLPKRFTDMTMDQRLAMKTFGEMGKAFQEKTTNFLQEFSAYNRKHKITVHELQQYGL